VSGGVFRAVSLVLGPALVVVAVGVAIVVGRSRGGRDEGARCGPGFVARGPRCLVGAGQACPRPLVSTASGCDAPDVRVLVPESTLVIGPSDWEAEGRVRARTVHAGPFRVDAFEVTRGRWAAGAADPARAASGMTRDEAEAFCRGQSPGGRLPTEDEWIVAAVAGATPPPRYPWGETGAVCRRAAWGLGAGPCANSADGPDTVGAHPDGDSPLGIHDLAGNVAEWVAPAEPAKPGEQAGAEAGPAAPGRGSAGLAKGGSWASDLAADLRVWADIEVAAGARDARVGLRCVYPP
jgi:formylglycine-generating enzyme required for sulfatase activity